MDGTASKTSPVLYRFKTNRLTPTNRKKREVEMTETSLKGAEQQKLRDQVGGQEKACVSFRERRPVKESRFTIKNWKLLYRVTIKKVVVKSDTQEAAPMEQVAAVGSEVHENAPVLEWGFDPENMEVNQMSDFKVVGDAGELAKDVLQPGLCSVAALGVVTDGSPESLPKLDTKGDNPVLEWRIDPIPNDLANTKQFDFVNDINVNGENQEKEMLKPPAELVETLDVVKKEGNNEEFGKLKREKPKILSVIIFPAPKNPVENQRTDSEKETASCEESCDERKEEVAGAATVPPEPSAILMVEPAAEQPLDLSIRINQEAQLFRRPKIFLGERLLFFHNWCALITRPPRAIEPNGEFPTRYIKANAFYWQEFLN
ncbi:hypothetical protein RF55_23078, partial [Lasius niger]